MKANLLKDKDFCKACGTKLSFGRCPGINCPTNKKLKEDKKNDSTNL